jgi:hypothetical protein
MIASDEDEIESPSQAQLRCRNDVLAPVDAPAGLAHIPPSGR